MTYEEFLKRIGNNIKRIRLEQFPQRSITDLAGHVNKNKKAWEKIENGEGNPELRTLKKIADVLNVEINELFRPAQPKTLVPTIEDIKRAGRRLSN